MKLLFVFVVITYIVISIDAQLPIPDELKPEADALRKEMERVGVVFIGDTPDPATDYLMSKELKAKADAFKIKLMAAGVDLPPI